MSPSSKEWRSDVLLGPFPLLICGHKYGMGVERRAEEEGHAGVGEVGKEGGGREGRKENKERSKREHGWGDVYKKNKKYIINYLFCFFYLF